MLIVAIVFLIIIGFFFNKGRSAIWGGVTGGLIIGLIVGFFTDNYWVTVKYAFYIGIFAGLGANILGWISDKMK